MDLIEVLWKQDVDLGFSLETAENKPEKEKPEAVEVEGSVPTPTTSLVVPDDDIEKLKALKAVNDDTIKVSFCMLAKTAFF